MQYRPVRASLGHLFIYWRPLSFGSRVECLFQWEHYMEGRVLWMAWRPGTLVPFWLGLPLLPALVNCVRRAQ